MSRYSVQLGPDSVVTAFGDGRKQPVYDALRMVRYTESGDAIIHGRIITKYWRLLRGSRDTRDILPEHNLTCDSFAAGDSGYISFVRGQRGIVVTDREHQLSCTVDDVATKLSVTGDLSTLYIGKQSFGRPRDMSNIALCDIWSDRLVNYDYAPCRMWGFCNRSCSIYFADAGTLCMVDIRMLGYAQHTIRLGRVNSGVFRINPGLCEDTLLMQSTGDRYQDASWYDLRACADYSHDMTRRNRNHTSHIYV